jgi:hypothetical protein
MRVEESLIFWSEVKEIFKKVSDKFDFKWQTRKRVLNTQILVTFLLKLVQSHNKQGYGSNLVQFWESCLDKNIILPQAKTVAASSLCEARQKLPEDVFIELNQNLLVLWNKTQDLPGWNGYRLFAIDGSRVNLPRELTNEGFIVCSADQGHYYPQGLMSCLYNIEDKVVYDFSLKAHLNERLSAIEHIQQLGSKDVVVLDRGYFSYLMLYKIIEQNCHVIFRIPFGSKNNTNNEIMNFIKTDQEDSIIDYMPSTTVMHDLRNDGYNLKFRPLKIRLIKHKINGTIYIYATTLIDKDIFPTECFGEIYHYRWNIEELYKISKRFIEIEDFHAKSARGIKQELYAHILLINLSRFFEFEAEKLIASNKSADDQNIKNTFDPITMIKINFKNCLLVVSRHLENLAMTSSILITSTLQRIISSIAKVRQKIRLNRQYPRISHKPVNRWVTSRRGGKFA